MLHPCGSLNEGEGMLVGRRQSLSPRVIGTLAPPKASEHRGGSHQPGDEGTWTELCGSKEAGALGQAPAHGPSLLFPDGGTPQCLGH